MIKSVLDLDKSRQALFVALPILLIVVIVLAYFGIRSFNKSTSAITELHDQLTQAQKQQSADEDDDDDDEIAGKADKYSWAQTDEDVELYVPLHTFSPVHKNEIDVKITNKHLRVTIRREQYLNDEFFSMVNADDCCWYLDNNNADRPVLTIALIKAVQGKGSSWDYILEKDASLIRKKRTKLPDMGGDFPPIHNIDTSDPASMRAALAAVSK